MLGERQQKLLVDEDRSRLMDINKRQRFVGVTSK